MGLEYRYLDTDCLRPSTIVLRCVRLSIDSLAIVLAFTSFSMVWGVLCSRRASPLPYHQLMYDEAYTF
jgi:hypothetical protein